MGQATRVEAAWSLDDLRGRLREAQRAQRTPPTVVWPGGLQLGGSHSSPASRSPNGRSWNARGMADGSVFSGKHSVSLEGHTPSVVTLHTQGCALSGPFCIGESRAEKGRVWAPGKSTSGPISLFSVTLWELGRPFHFQLVRGRWPIRGNQLSVGPCLSQRGA